MMEAAGTFESMVMFLTVLPHEATLHTDRRQNYNVGGAVKKHFKLLIFERKIFRRILGPTQKANRVWRLKTNEELEDAINNENIVRYIKHKRLGWLG